jgi:hypothetical protein
VVWLVPGQRSRPRQLKLSEIMPYKIHLIISGLIAIAFLITLQVFASPLPVFRFLLPAFILYLGATMLYNRWYLQKQNLWHFWLWLRVPLFLTGWFGLFFLVPNGFGRGLFLLASLPIIFFFQALVGNTGQQLGWNEFLLTLAALLLSLFGFSYYFNLPGVVYLLAVFLGVAVVVRSSLANVPHEPVVKWVAAMALGLFATELFWVTSFLPLHYTALAIFTFTILYMLWIIYYHYLYHTLTRRQVQFHLVLAVVLIVVMFVSTPWGIQS